MATTPPDKVIGDQDIKHLETANTLDVLTSDAPELDSQAEKRLIRKIDRRQLPVLGALYSIALIDRINISAARVAGMGEDLELNIGNRYTVALLVFFIPYIIFELPSNIVLRKVGSANWLAFIAFSWGVVMIGQAFVKSYEGLVACRTLLGFFESGFFPACVYLVSCWYVRYEVQKRMAFFYLCSVLVGAFASLLAYGIMQMEGIGNLRGWQWIFVLEGIATVLVACGSWFIIVDFPDRAEKKGFLSHEEAAFVNRRIEIDRNDAVPDPLTWAKFFHHLKDWKLWVFATQFMSSTMPANALAFFTPVIINGMGYSAGAANALSAPPTCFAVFSAMTFAWLGDKFRLRGPFIVIQALLTIVGLMITAYHPRNGVRYFGLFLGTAGCQGNIPAVLAYQSNNIRMQSKRSVGSALLIGFGGIGGILASTTFKQSEAPKYRSGLWATVALQLWVISSVGAMTCYFLWKNKKVDNGSLKKPIEGLEGFKYTL